MARGNANREVAIGCSESKLVRNMISIVGFSATVDAHRDASKSAAYAYLLACLRHVERRAGLSRLLANARLFGAALLG